MKDLMDIKQISMNMTILTYFIIFNFIKYIVFELKILYSINYYNFKRYINYIIHK